ncbi:MAG TPA: hypothetical protein VFE31_01045 [Opitutaceae bacterium]|jgi:hypothetical protein|nr:hypothetical protein [Opitutaceae bacterium]
MRRRTKALRWAGLLAAALGAGWGLVLCAGCRPSPSSSAFPYPIPFQTGSAEFQPGDGIAIESVTGTRPALESGGSYCVTGTYALASRDEASLALFETLTRRIVEPFDPRQEIRVIRGAGRFRLIIAVPEKGYLHVSFYPRSGGRSFGKLYFGQGDWLLREPVTPAPVAAAFASARLDPNERLMAYLGRPGTRPATLDPGYSRGGLLAAVTQAARASGATVRSISIDDSEFPYLVGIVCPRADFEKLAAELFKNSKYRTTGSVSGDDIHVFSPTPIEICPPEERISAQRRLMVRYQMLYDRLSQSAF